MNIKSLLLVADNIHFGGGGERVACNIANHYVSKGVCVEILSFGSCCEKSVFNLSNDVRIYYFNAGNNKVLQKIEEFFKLRRFLKLHKYDVIMSIGCSPSVVLGMASNHRYVTVGTEHFYYYGAPKIWNSIRRIAYPKLSSITVLTHHDLPYVKNINPKACVVPNALSYIPKKKIDPNKKIFLAVGRLSPVKQFEKMLRIMKTFVFYNQEWELHIIGKGELRDYLMQLVSQYGLSNYVRILPYSNNMEGVYLSASVLLSTSKSEGLPMTMIEGQSYGMPIVAYDCLTGPSEIVIDGRNGYLIPQDDSSAFLKRMQIIAENATLRHEMSKNAIRDSERFYPEVVYNKWDTLFNSILL